MGVKIAEIATIKTIAILDQYRTGVQLGTGVHNVPTKKAVSKTASDARGQKQVLVKSRTMYELVYKN